MKYSVLLFLLFPVLLHAQGDVSIGEWKTHQSYNQSIKSVESGDFIYCASRFGLFNVHREERSVTTLTKVDGLSGVELSEIAYSERHNLVFVAYTDGNIDIIGDNFIKNIPYIATTTVVIGSKQINSISFYEDRAYIATSFGVVVYDMVKENVPESYLNLSPRGNKLIINDIAVFDGRVYIATDIGIRSGDLDDNLLDFELWRTDIDGSFSAIETFNNQLIIYSDSNELYQYDGKQTTLLDDDIEVQHLDVNHNQLVVTKQNYIDVYDQNWSITSEKANAAAHGLVDANGDMWVCAPPFGILKYVDGDISFIKPNGPDSHNCWTVDYANGEIWVASGGLDLAYNAVGINSGFYRYKDRKWDSYNDRNTTEISRLRDMHLVRVDEKTRKKYVASYNLGIAEVSKNNEVRVWDKASAEGAMQSVNNSPSENAPVRIAGMDLDSQGNLWMTQQFAEDQLVVKTKDDEWHSYNIGSNKRVNDVLVDGNGHKWVVIHLDGIYVYNDGDDPTTEVDDVGVVTLSATKGNGDLPANDVYALTLDKDRNVWVGTSDGITVFYNTNAIFETGVNYDGVRPLIGEGDETAWLLEGQKINAIAIDGANQKWIATLNGVFVTNPNGNEILYNFNVDNSPLLSNNIRDLDINGRTGEVFMATDKGLISYRAEAVDGGETHNDVYVYPNPVRPGYTGAIAITGLVENANVKIADISGNLVFETQAQGGQAVWDGKTFGGREVSSGVYLVFSTNRTGSETFISKIMIIR